MIIFYRYGGNREGIADECLGRYLELTGRERPGGPVAVGISEGGKPFFEDYPGIRFSVSHSGDLTVVAVGGSETGIDVEKIRERPYRKLAERYFTEGERAGISCLRDFFSVWTKKEALLKYAGEGLRGLRTADVSKGRAPDGKEVRLVPLDVFEGYAGAVATASDEPMILMSLE